MFSAIFQAYDRPNRKIFPEENSTSKNSSGASRMELDSTYMVALGKQNVVGVQKSFFGTEASFTFC